MLKNQTRRLALCGSMVALAAFIMLLGGLIPLATFCCPALAGLLLLPLVFDCGDRMAYAAYAAIALLSLILCPDKEAALLFVFLGYYPVLKWRFEKIPKKAKRIGLKFLLWNAAIAVMYALIILVFRLESVVAEMSEMTALMLILLVLLGNVTLVVYDRALFVFSMLYLKKFRKKH